MNVDRDDRQPKSLGFVSKANGGPIYPGAAASSYSANNRYGHSPTYYVLFTIDGVLRLGSNVDLCSVNVTSKKVKKSDLKPKKVPKFPSQDDNKVLSRLSR